MKLEMKFENLPPMFRNHSHMPRNNMIIKTPMARAFEEEMSMRLFEIDPAIIKSFNKAYDKKKHYIINLTVISAPANILWTLTNTIDQHSGDWDAHKCYFDCIFKHIGIDDSQAMDNHVFKRESDDENWNFYTTLIIRERILTKGLEQWNTFTSILNTEKSQSLL